MVTVGLVSDEQRDAQLLEAAVEEKHAQLVVFPCISIEPLHDNTFVYEKLQQLASYDWVIFTSKNAVAFFFKALQIANVELPSSIKVAAVGTATAAALQNYDVRVDLVPKEFSSVRLAQTLGKQIAHKRILFPRSAIAFDEAREVLTLNGASVDPLPVHTIASKPLSKEQRTFFVNGEVSLLVFLSPSGIRGLNTALGADSESYLKGITAVCIGPRTAQEAKKHSFRKVVTAKKATMQCVVDEVVQLL